MKPRKYLLIFGLLTSMSLTSCGNSPIHYDENQYCLDLPYKENYKVLQLSDIHLGMNDDLNLHFKFMNLTIDEAQPDLIVFTGDLFTFANRKTVDEVFSYINRKCAEINAHFAVTWGNHDEQIYMPFSEMTRILSDKTTFDRCVFTDLINDDVYGNANYVIRLRQGNLTKKALYIFDSNRYHYGSYFNNEYISYSGYDYIHQDQIDWYERMVNYVGASVPSISYFHIPLPEYKIASDLYESGSGEVTSNKENDKNGEKICCPDFNSGLFDKMVELNSTKAIFVGHDHINDTSFKYKGIDLNYGLHSSNNVYYDDDKMGGVLVTFNEDSTHETSYLYHTYSEIK